MSEVYYCENCGGVMEFDVASQALKCPHCGTIREIRTDGQKVEEHRLTGYAKREIRAEEKRSTTMQCPSCGAIVEVEATSTAKECPYCGTAFVLAEKQLSNIVPDGVLPFKIDKNRVGEIFRRWMKGRWLAPGELKHLYQKDKLQGIYIPYWTFDADATADYAAEGGKNHPIRVRNAKGVEETLMEIRWQPTRGRVGRFFDDVQVHASDRLDDRLIREIEPFHTKEIPPYSPDYLSGYSSEVYTVDLEDAHRTARTQMERELYALAEQDVLRRYDHVRNVRLNASYRSETYKHVLLPVYATSYHYKKRQYTVLINGETGRIQGEYPKSPAKIALLVFAAAVLIGAFFFLTSDRRGDRYGYETPVYAEAEYEQIKEG